MFWIENLSIFGVFMDPDPPIGKNNFAVAIKLLFEMIKKTHIIDK